MSTRVLLGFVYMLLRPRGAVTGTLHREGCAQIRQLDIDCDGVVLARVPFRGKATHSNPPKRASYTRAYLTNLIVKNLQEFTSNRFILGIGFILNKTDSTVFPKCVLCIIYIYHKPCFGWGSRYPSEQ